MMGRSYWKWIFFAMAGFGLLLIFTANRDDPRASIPTAVVHRGDIDILVRTVGRLEAAQARMISSTLPGDKGKIVWIVSDGTSAQEGDELVRFDATPFEGAVRQLEAKAGAQESVVEALEQAVSWEISQTKSKIRTAEYEVRVAAMELQQLERGDGPLELACKEEGFNEAKRKHRDMRGYLADLKRLAKDGYVDDVEVERAEVELKSVFLDLEVAERKFISYRDYILPAEIERKKAEFERRERDLEEIRKSCGFKIGESKAKLEEGRRQQIYLTEQLKAATRRLADTVINAPQDGIVVLAERHYAGQLRKPRVGDVTWQGQPLIYLPNLNEMIVKTYVREIDLHRLSVGQKAQVFLDAFPDLCFSGKVVRIGTMAEKSKADGGNGAKVFSMIASLEGQDDRLRPGMTSRVEARGDSRQNVLLVPLSAIFGNGDSRWCYVQENEVWRRSPVKVGLTGEQKVEIIEGLESGQMIALVEP